MTWFNTHLESSGIDPNDDQLDQLMDLLDAYSPSLGISPRGLFSVRISLQATNLRQAVDLAQLAIKDALQQVGLPEEPTAVTAMTEAEFLRREETPEAPEIVGTGEAAAIMGVSHQRVGQLAQRLHGVKIGKTLVFLRSTVEAAARKNAET